MSDRIQPEYPDEFKLSVWEKKKGSPPSGHEVGEGLKALHKKQVADWKPGSTRVVPAPALH